jgi:peptide methionine sulfoxide reductase MsrA
MAFVDNGEITTTPGAETAVLAGGCFWGAQELLRVRSAIFYTSEEQKKVALDTIKDVDASGLWPGKVVTEVTPAGAFWQAEEEHQDYLRKYPNGYTCHFVRPGWKLPHRESASESVSA